MHVAQRHFSVFVTFWLSNARGFPYPRMHFVKGTTSFLETLRLTLRDKFDIKILQF